MSSASFTPSAIPAGQSVLETRQLGFRYGDLWAVSGLDLAVGKGEIFGVVGPDGAGKSTLLRLLCGLLEPSTGSLLLWGREAGEVGECLRRRLGYLPQRFSLYPDLTVEENLRFYAQLYEVPPRERLARTRELLELTGLSPFLGRRASQLSGGMKQKLALMACLLHQPALLLLDEPTTGVDPSSRRDFWKLLYQLLQEGITIVVSTAYLDEAERCTRVAFLNQGRLLACDSTERLRSQVRLPCYLVQGVDPRRAHSLLRSLPEVLHVQFAGRHLRLCLRRDIPEDIRQNLRREGLSGAQLVPAEPTVEDLFLALAGREGN